MKYSLDARHCAEGFRTGNLTMTLKESPSSDSEGWGNFQEVAYLGSNRALAPKIMVLSKNWRLTWGRGNKSGLYSLRKHIWHLWVETPGKYGFSPIHIWCLQGFVLFCFALFCFRFLLWKFSDMCQSRQNSFVSPDVCTTIINSGPILFHLHSHLLSIPGLFWGRFQTSPQYVNTVILIVSSILR